MTRDEYRSLAEAVQRGASLLERMDQLELWVGRFSEGQPFAIVNGVGLAAEELTLGERATRQACRVLLECVEGELSELKREFDAILSPSSNGGRAISFLSPYTQDYVDALNRQQRDGRFHPYTCPDAHVNGDRVLVATQEGWLCPSCDYRQPFSQSPTLTEDQSSGQ